MYFKAKEIVAALFLLCMGHALVGQSDVFYTFFLEKEINLKAGGVFVHPLKNVGAENPIDVNSFLEKSIEKACLPLAGDGNEKAGNVNAWSQMPLFWQATSPDKADVVVSGSYNIEKESDAEVFRFYETNTAISNPIPYFEVRPKNRVSAEVILQYKYADGTLVSDTLRFHEISERKKNTKLKSMEKLLAECQKALEYDFRKLFLFADYETAKFSLEKVKVSDKGLKEELKSAGDLLKGRRIADLGNLYKRIYENEPSKEAAFCLGICYELVGNYPMAAKYYKQMPEFHTIARMKKSLILFDYLQSIGAELKLEEF